MVNAGIDVTLGNLKARIPTAGNRSLQVSTVSGTYTVYGSGTINSGAIASGAIDGATPLSVTTTPAYLKSSTNLGGAGYTEIWTIMDTGNTIACRISLIIGTSFNNNMISIERLV
jgi:type IV secretory pathway VirB6-like protein